MPGILRKTAVCPSCGTALCALVDHTSCSSVRRSYYHEKPLDGSRRKYPCSEVFTNLEQAERERRGLEVPIRNGKPTKQYSAW